MAGIITTTFRSLPHLIQTLLSNLTFTMISLLNPKIVLPTPKSPKSTLPSTSTSPPPPPPPPPLSKPSPPPPTPQSSYLLLTNTPPTSNPPSTANSSTSDIRVDVTTSKLPPTTTTKPAAPAPLVPSVKSHQTGTIETHWNDLPADIHTPSPSPSRSITPESQLKANLLARIDFSTPPTQDELDVFFAHRNKAVVVDRERDIVREKVEKVLGDARTEERIKGWVGGIVRGVNGGMGGGWAKGECVGFVVREKGVAGRVGGVRRWVEGLEE